jgi:tripeptide aminopeptidase
LALADVHSAGWFGKIAKNGREGTSNVGSFGGKDGQSAGEATNVVTDYVHIKGESRSHHAPFAHAITAAYRDAFRRAGKKVVDHRGRCAKVHFQSRHDYYPFRLKETSPAVQFALDACRRAGWEADLRVTNGGLDANWTVRHGIPTVTFGGGQHEIHTVDEYVDVGEFLEGCRLALSLAAG